MENNQENENRDCDFWELSPAYEKFKNEYNPPRKNCGTCSHYRPTGCEEHRNILDKFRK